jgi:hypothetical protein
MKKGGGLIGVIVVVVVLLGGYVVALPYIIIDNIKTSVQDHDQEKMAENINFSVLSENFRRQFNEQLSKSHAIKNKMQNNDNPYAIIEVISLTSKMAYELTSTIITPTGLTNIMIGEKLLQDGIAVNQQTTKNRNILKNAKYSFDDINSFSALVKNDNDEDVRFVLTRNGLSWKLTNIIFPLRCDACHEDRSSKRQKIRTDRFSVC